LFQILEWCQDLGVREVTVYAFSIENFKRSSEEVDGLMKLAEEKFAKLLAQREKLEEQHISFRFFGNIAMLSPKLRKLIAQIQLLTKDYDRGVVNVCMPYTSRDELARAFELIRKGREKSPHWFLSVLAKLSSVEDNCIPSLQCSTSHVYFDDVLWPEFNYWHLCKAILSYQYHCSSIQVWQ
ncbi:di-trans,poly-cis-decaprenylcistransferase-like protein, partial [Ancylostoma duodenale]